MSDSSAVNPGILVVVISFFAFTLNIAIALWLGDMLGKSYYGFLIVAAVYALVAVILLIVHPIIKNRASNAIIRELFN